MALELEAPTTTEQPAVKLFTEPPAAAAAVTLLDGTDGADGTESADEPQRDGSTSVTVRLTQEVEDATSAFSGHAGETFDAYIDADGNTWIPLPAGDICLEAEEFEIVQPLADATAEIGGLLDRAAEEIAEVVLEAVAADPLPPVIETPPAAVAEPAAVVPPPPPAPKPQPSDYEIRRRQYLREKDVLQEQISALMIEQAKLKEQVKKCKKEAEVYCEQLSELIDDWESSAASLENEPPTAATPTDATSTSIDAGGTGIVQPDRSPEMTTAQTEHAGTSDSSQASQPSKASQAAEQAAEQAHYQRILEAASVDQLGLPAKLIERLQEAGATTVWRLEQLRAEIAQGREKWPKGIGEAKITQIEDAIISWMGRNSETWSKGYRDAITEEDKAAETVKAKDPPEAGPAVSTDIDDL